MDLEEDRLASLGKHTGTSKMLLPVFNPFDESEYFSKRSKHDSYLDFSSVRVLRFKAGIWGFL